jgi:hypothetical protein
MQADVESEAKRIEHYYESLCSMHGLQPKPPTLTTLEKKAQQIIPERKFRGIMDRTSVIGAMVAKSKGEIWSSKGTNEADLLAGYEEDERWYEKRAEKMGGLRNVIFELNNLIDGKRSVLDIRNALSAELGETDLEFVMRYISDLERFGLATTK